VSSRAASKKERASAKTRRFRRSRFTNAVARRPARRPPPKNKTAVVSVRAPAARLSGSGPPFVGPPGIRRCPRLARQKETQSVGPVAGKTRTGVQPLECPHSAIPFGCLVRRSLPCRTVPACAERRITKRKKRRPAPRPPPSRLVRRSPLASGSLRALRVPSSLSLVGAVSRLVAFLVAPSARLIASSSRSLFAWGARCAPAVSDLCRGRPEPPEEKPYASSAPAGMPVSTIKPWTPACANRFLTGAREDRIFSFQPGTYEVGKKKF